jgi:STE24 endopeptidase
VLVGAWAIAAHLLLPTEVPDSLHLPQVEPRRYFTAAQLHRASDYETFLRVLAVLSALTLVGVLALYARHGGRFARESAAGRVGTGMLLGMLGLGFVWLAQLPFDVVGLWWERRHHISRQGYLEVILGSWVGLAGVFLGACVAILIAMGLARPFRRSWWLPAAPVFVAIGLGVSFLNPYLMSSDLHPLRKPAIERDSRQLERAERLPHIPVKVEKVHRQTTAPNAEAVGLGPSRRVVLWDTLLDGRFSRKQVSVILAHELGHHSRHHIWKGLGWYGLFALPLAWLVATITRRRGGLYRPEAVPLALLVVVTLQIVTLPAQNVISRRFEAEADWVALQNTHDPPAARALFQRLASTSLSQPRPPTWAYVMFENHPTIVQRIAMVDAWETRRRGGR